jgi:glutamyl-tRNA reductase
VKKGKAVAGRYGVSFNEWGNLDKELLEANIVVGAATATQGNLFDKDSFTKVMSERRGRTLLLIDIAVPRNFAPEINEIENVYLYSVDDLAHVVQENIKLRQEDVEQAIGIICEKATEFMDWFATKDIGPLIGQIKGTFDQIRQNELDRFFVGHRQDASCKDSMEQTVSRVVQKLLHCVIKNISVIAKEQGVDDATKLASSIVEHAQEILAGDKEKRKGQ